MKGEREGEQAPRHGSDPRRVWEEKRKSIDTEVY